MVALRCWVVLLAGLVLAGGCGNGGRPFGGVDLGLAELQVPRGALEPPFAPSVRSYTVRCPVDVVELELAPRAAASAFALTVDGVALAAGQAAVVPLDRPRRDVVVGVHDADGAVVEYAIAALRFDEREVLSASTAAAGDAQGHDGAVAIDGDTLVVGAPRDDGAADLLPESGAVHVFARDGDGWGAAVTLRAPNAGAGDWFGASVAVAGDLVAVGAPWEDSAGSGVDGGMQDDDSLTSSGAVYLFRRDGAGWRQEAYVKPMVPGLGDGFGDRIALSGDTLVVGARLEDSGGVGIDSGMEADDSQNASGAVYVFERRAGVWVQTAYVKAANTGASDWFGCSVAIDGDTLVVGARNESSSAAGPGGSGFDDDRGLSGAAYVFVRDGGGWRQQEFLKAAAPGRNDLFGAAVAVRGDTLVVGAPGEASAAAGLDGDAGDDSAPGAGAAYLFVRTAGGWQQRHYLKATNPGIGDGFGRTVAIGDDLIAVGAPDEAAAGTGLRSAAGADDSAAGAGAAYLVARVDGAPSAPVYVKAVDNGAGRAFGAGVATTGATAAVAAPGAGAAAGAVHVFR